MRTLWSKGSERFIEIVALSEMLKKAIKKIKHRVKERLVLSYFFQRLNVIGITITPLYLTQEFLFDEKDLILRPELDPITMTFLSSTEVKKIYDYPESREMGLENRTFLEEGCLCFALKYNDEIAAYMWCDLLRCHGFYPFFLQADEAYLFGAYTFKAYRGKNLAPFLRNQVYKHLNQLGRTKIYSLTDILNTPAIKFKKKLKAKPLKIIINIKFFNKYNWNILMRSPKSFIVAI